MDIDDHIARLLGDMNYVLCSAGLTFCSLLYMLAPFKM